MPRRNRRPKPPPVPDLAAASSTIGAPKGWTARRVMTREAGPDYTCPRCQRMVVRHSEHVVARFEEEQHRHWHTACWASATKEGLERYRWA